MSSSPPRRQDASPEQQQQQARAFMSSLDPQLVHRVLLTDPADYSSLTASGRPRQSPTPAYDDEFLRGNDFLPPPPSPSSSSSADGAGSGEEDVAERIARTMRRAFHDAMIESVMARGDLDQVRGTLLELHDKLRQLVPNRTDLHGTLDDDDVRRMTLGGDRGRSGDGDGGGAAAAASVSAASDVDAATSNGTTTACTAEEKGDHRGEGGDASRVEAAPARAEVIRVVVPHLIKAAAALERLESEDRSVTTRAWIQLATVVLSSSSSSSSPTDGTTTTCTIPHGMEPAAFVVSSLAYLHVKADLCGTDVADYHLSHTLAPRIAALGVEHERSIFVERFGPFDDGTTAPVTREWICRTVDGCGVPRDELRASEEKRVLALQAYGWVDSILFQASGGGGDGSTGEGTAPSPPPPPMPIRVPEVLQNDVANLRRIREATRMSVVGSALALHACTVAGVGDAVLRTHPPSAGVNRCRDGLVSAMAHRGVGSQETYERGVSAAVVELARVFKPSLGAPEEDILVSRTSAVLRGEDPVIKLLDDRMRMVFREMMAWEPTDAEKVPLSMKSGRSLSVHRGMASGATTTYSTLFEDAARRQFVSRGFAFYAAELATAAITATKVINLVFVLYGEDFIDKVFLQALDEALQR